MLGATRLGSVIIHGALNKGHLRLSVFSSHYSPSGRLEGPKSVRLALPAVCFFSFVCVCGGWGSGRGLAVGGH